MNLQIRDPRARKLAEQLAAELNITMTEAVVEALEEKMQRLEKQRATKTPLAERHSDFAARFQALGQGEGRVMSKDEIDEMWGH
ncbi:type II toxin-antitoxin system VapB family antitoxin [Rhizobium sp. XQZ8]|uniref:type II toxin-antitoxin system VapB family antitoxin n=1 Tax=Rhizobium populisoli TaxID=2859785 RepID=UPI001C683E0C|nr:type II toxin-antitoxin system VapB family antitoxin [Rhizobium populisoli]MBW6422174.1 type II toxin-antitoxin system VapB family antitoxin [Rhizobium populisoli]